MHLLSKNEIENAKSNEKRLQINDGISLARKIDTLRKTSSEEESKLAKFRDESLKRIREEIDGLIKEKNELSQSVINLKEEQRVLRIPLDAEWQALRTSKSKLNEIDQELESRGIEISKREKDIKEKQDQLKIDTEHLFDRKKELESEIESMRETQIEADSILSSAKSKDHLAQVRLDESSKEIRAKEIELLHKFTDLENREKSLVKRWNEVINKEKTVNDKYETLQRTINRLKT